MNSIKLFLTGILLILLFVVACTRVDYTNPYDSRGSNYLGDSTVIIITHNSTPTITLVGLDTVIIAKGDPHHIASTLEATVGASATDSVFGNLTDSIKLTSNLFTSTCGIYTLVYSVTNSVPHTAQVSRTVIVDCEAPVITLNGVSPDSAVHGTTYSDPGYVATDNVDKTVNVTVTNRVTTAHDGVDSIIYSATDRAGNSDTVVRTVIVYTPLVKDTIPPVITLTGAKDTSIAQNSVYRDPGATATDNNDVTITVSVSGTVNPAVAGVYTLTYNATDKSGNNAAPVTRKVTVIQLGGKPVITLKGPNPDTVKVGSGAFKDPGYSAVDGSGKDVTDSVKIAELYGKTIVTTSPGAYTLVYTLYDTVSTTRSVYVVGVSTDNTPPVITLSGKNPDTVKVGSGKYADQFSANDDVDGVITNKVQRVFKNSSGTAVDSNTFTATIGGYTITYSVSDANANAATPKTRNVYVKDTTTVPPGNLLEKYGVPLAAALPSVSNITYKTITVDGTGPSMSTVTSFVMNWDLANNGLYGFAFNYSGPPYYASFTSITQNFKNSSPQFTITGTGISGLDGSYYITASATQCVWVRTDGSFAVVFKP